MQSTTIGQKAKAWFSQPSHLFHSVIWLLTGILYYPVFRLLYSARWDNIDYSHAYFILPVAIFMGWKAIKRNHVIPECPAQAGRESTFSSRDWIPDQVRYDMKTRAGMTNKDIPPSSTLQSPLASSARPLWGYTALFVLGLATFVFGWRQDYTSVSTFSLLPVLFGLIGCLYGSRTVRILWFPILYLLLLVPPPLGVIDSLTLPMRYGVSTVTEKMVGLAGFPITRDGLLLLIGGHEVFLGEACSGFRSLITLSSLGLAYIFIAKCSSARKLAMAASIIPLALLGNLIRVVSVVIVTYYLGETLGQKFFHDASGFVMFVVMIAGLLAVENMGKQKNVSSIKQEACHAGLDPASRPGSRLGGRDDT